MVLLLIKPVFGSTSVLGLNENFTSGDGFDTVMSVELLLLSLNVWATNVCLGSVVMSMSTSPTIW